MSYHRSENELIFYQNVKKKGEGGKGGRIFKTEDNGDFNTKEISRRDYKILCRILRTI